MIARTTTTRFASSRSLARAPVAAISRAQNKRIVTSCAVGANGEPVNGVEAGAAAPRRALLGAAALLAAGGAAMSVASPSANAAAAASPSISQKVYLDIQQGDASLGRIVLGLYGAC